MSTKNNNRTHRKYTGLTKSYWGLFGRNEVGILGAPCPTVRKLADTMIKYLSGKYNLAYADAEHGADRAADPRINPTNARLTYTEKQQSLSFDHQRELSDYQKKTLFNETDLVLVNGNHFPADCQIVVIDHRKSLEGKQDLLTDVRLVILQEGIGEIPAEIRQIVNKEDTIPIYRMNDTEKILRAVEQIILDRIPSLAGLILAGGQSSRMHTDKTVLEYHGKPQRRHLYELLDGFCDKVYLSCRRDQLEELPKQLNTIADSFTGMGPMGGLLSAFRQNPRTAWLVVACDLPLLSRQSLQYLIANRNPSKTATAFINPESSFPEPLITIWEPKSYPVLLHFLSLGYTSPREVLINTEIERLEAPYPRELINVNRPEEYRKIIETLASMN